MKPRANSVIYETTASDLFDRKMSKTEKRKLQIVEQSIALFAKKGFDEVSFEVIAARCKVSRPLINHYFKDKLELFQLVVKYIRILFQKSVLAEMSQQKNQVDAFRAYLTAALRWHEDEPQHGKVWMLYFYMSGVDIRIRKEHTELVDFGANRIAQLLQSLARPELLSSEEALRKSRLIQMVITGSLVAEGSEERTIETIQRERSVAFENCCQIAGLRS